MIDRRPPSQGFTSQNSKKLHVFPSLLGASSFAVGHLLQFDLAASASACPASGNLIAPVRAALEQVGRCRMTENFELIAP